MIGNKMKNMMATIALVAAQSRHELNTGKIWHENWGLARKGNDNFNIWSQCWDTAQNFCECRWSIGGGDSGNCEMSTGKLTLYFPEDPNNARVMLATNSFGWEDEPEARVKYTEDNSFFVWGDFSEREYKDWDWYFEDERGSYSSGATNIAVTFTVALILTTVI